jgi:hypothetical protein
MMISFGSQSLNCVADDLNALRFAADFEVTSELPALGLHKVFFDCAHMVDLTALVVTELPLTGFYLVMLILAFKLVYAGKENEKEDISSKDADSMSEKDKEDQKKKEGWSQC